MQDKPIQRIEPLTISPEEVCRELDKAITRTESLGHAIVTNLDEAERELDEIRQGPAFRSRQAQ
jgi:hypothetical protein